MSHLLYADDLLIISETHKGLQESLNYLEKYCCTWGLEVNLKKSNVMEITDKRKFNSIEFFFGKQQIKMCDRYRYLGIIIDNKGTFRSAMEYLKSKGR